MKIPLNRSNLLVPRNSYSFFVFMLAALWLVGCARPPGFGVGGRYLDAKQEMANARSGDITKTITLLESVAVKDPQYKDTLTLLGRAYYRAGRYADALQVLKRALALDKKDEIAWIALGLAQLQVGDDDNGLDSFKGGITLLSRVAKEGYRRVDDWDKKGLVRSALRRAAFAVLKGVENKPAVIESGETLLTRIDQEERLGKIEEQEEQRVN